MALLTPEICVCERQKDDFKALQRQEGWRDGQMIEGRMRLFVSDVLHHISWPWWVHTLHLCSDTLSLSSSLFFFPPSPVICSWNPSCFIPCLTYSYFLPHISPSLVTSCSLSSSHNNTSLSLPIFRLSLSFPLNFLLHYSLLTFGVALRDEYPFTAFVCVDVWMCASMRIHPASSVHA